MEKRTIAITDTTWRDSHQSLLATRMRIEDMLPIAEKWTQWGFTLWRFGEELLLILVCAFK